MLGTGSTPSLSSSAYNNLNQLTSISSGGPMRFKGHLDELGTVTVGGTPATVDSRTTNFIGYATVTLGTNTIPIVATDYSGNVRSNRYQVLVTNLLTAASPQYDANGNMTNDGAGLTYEWDAADRLTAINRGTTNRTEFLYDGFGRRLQIIEKTNGLAYGTNKYLWCRLEICEQRNNTGGAVVRRFLGEGEQISGTNYFFTSDHLGSVREMSDASAAVRAHYDYDPYGVRTKLSGTADADFGYTAHLMIPSQPDHTLTLYRLYRPDLGRWISRDPAAEVGDPSLYRYVGGNPIDLADADGLGPSSSPISEPQRNKLPPGEPKWPPPRPVPVPGPEDPPWEPWPWKINPDLLGKDPLGKFGGACWSDFKDSDFFMNLQRTLKEDHPLLYYVGGISMLGGYDAIQYNLGKQASLDHNFTYGNWTFTPSIWIQDNKKLSCGGTFSIGLKF